MIYNLNNLVRVVIVGIVSSVSFPGVCSAQTGFLSSSSLLGSLRSITASTSPPSGEVNPYGVAFVPSLFPSGGTIAAGDVLVSNFNNGDNVQGTGTTIVSISPTGQQSVFATSTGIGLDTALGVLSAGFVVVGNLPVNAGTIGAGSLQIFDRNGNLVSTLTGATLLDSPWDLTINDQGSQAQIFVSNVVSTNITRLDISIINGTVTVNAKTLIASGYAWAPNAQVVAVGPTGLAYDQVRDVLYVASTLDNEIFGVNQAGSLTSSAGKGVAVFKDQTNLHGPLGLVLAPNGHLICANGDAVNAGGTSNGLVEFTPEGYLVATYQLDNGNPGAAFGIASITSAGATTSQPTVKFAAVNDNLNAVTVWTLQ
jgi:sugar lactone lactonase YvrE